MPGLVCLYLIRRLNDARSHVMTEQNNFDHFSSDAYFIGFQYLTSYS